MDKKKIIQEVKSNSLIHSIAAGLIASLLFEFIKHWFKFWFLSHWPFSKTLPITCFFFILIIFSLKKTCFNYIAKITLVLLIVLIAPLAFTFSLHAIYPGHIKGEVIASNGKPLSNVRINIFSSKIDSVGFETVTDDFGFFIFPHLKEQPYYGLIYIKDNTKLKYCEFYEFAQKENQMRTYTFPIKKIDAPQDTVHFEHNSISLNSEAEDKLKSLGEKLLKNNSHIVIIYGNCDLTGTPEYNDKLGARRTKKVKSFLNQIGIEKERILMISHGDRYPVEIGNNPVANAKNRMVCFNIIPDNALLKKVLSSKK